MTNTITRRQFLAADNLLLKTKQLIETLKNINRRDVETDEIYERFNEFKKFVIGLHAASFHTVEQGKEQYKNRPEDLIQAAASRVSAIPGEINLLEKTFELRVKAVEYRRKQLADKSFSEIQIDSIEPTVPMMERIELEQKIAELKQEQERLSAFCGDFPEYCVEKIKGTAVYPWAVDEAA